MGNQRLLVWTVFGFLAWLTYQQWMQDYGTIVEESVVPVLEESLVPATEDTGLPVLLDGPIHTPQVEAVPTLPKTPVTAINTGLIRVRTDVFEVDIDTRGGTLRAAEFKSMTSILVSCAAPSCQLELKLYVGTLGPMPASMSAASIHPPSSHKRASSWSEFT